MRGFSQPASTPLTATYKPSVTPISPSHTPDTWSGSIHDMDLVHCIQPDSSTTQTNPAGLYVTESLLLGCSSLSHTELPPHVSPIAASDSHVSYTDPLYIYTLVQPTGLPNYLSARIPLPHALNMPVWRQLLCHYSDSLLCDFLEFGWPINYSRSHWPVLCLQNHASALAYPQQIQDYMAQEVSHQAMLGPFNTPPFPIYQINPLMTKSKKGCDTKKWVIVDLSWPHGFSVNDGISKDVYLGEPVTLKYPTVDTLVSLILQHGPGCLLYSVDLARAYRQWRSDPLDWPLLGIMWDNSFYFDISIPFGLRPGAMFCQRVTDSIRHILQQSYITVVNYIDDFAAIFTPDKADSHFHSLRSLLQQLGVCESTDKATAPHTTMT